MNLKSILIRLQGTLERNDLVEKMVLLPGAKATPSNWAASALINIVVGYNGSAKSHAALDLTLWIAHQTRLATQKQVVVQVVYVLEQAQGLSCLDCLPALDLRLSQSPPQVERVSGSYRSTVICQEPPVLVKAPLGPGNSWPVDSWDFSSPLYQADSLEQADQILWQARCLAEEWRGSLKTHLRFGSVAQELRNVVDSEAGALLLLGCSSGNHPLIQALGSDFPCPVLGDQPGGAS